MFCFQTLVRSSEIGYRKPFAAKHVFVRALTLEEFAETPTEFPRQCCEVPSPDLWEVLRSLVLKFGAEALAATPRSLSDPRKVPWVRAVRQLEPVCVYREKLAPSVDGL